ncbi:TcpQ domain-containing protein [Bordetella genomosp. 11]|uniref:Toxin co-regulated pilus biosynthesis protein Q C-terminal domain-containing protein n=1 Tax=Bordetella genomosp. 11 TaxID=1416808 RepID=A0A261UD20_9BORD|nr:TcpQ domain-containing protein [Bordetella genomosp. 11]OZI59818.1 hypothetical protein CAL28_10000 [Bordetella genomosp. 11]
MHRLFKTFFLLPWLSACAPSWAPAGAATGGAGDRGAAPPTGQTHDFNWRLSGDRQVAPLQVFDDGRNTWLQFAPGQAIPALFVEHDRTERPAAYERREPYAIIRGKWPSVIMRGGTLQARADYLGVAAQQAVPAPPAVARAAPGPGQVAAAQGSVDSAAGRLYRVGPADENMRRALARWAGLAGWTFQSEHWAVDVDIPLSASADFSDDFKRSVRALVAATELGERPLQPCFYANQVLRVIPLSQSCDRTAARPGASL